MDHPRAAALERALWLSNENLIDRKPGEGQESMKKLPRPYVQRTKHNSLCAEGALFYLFKALPLPSFTASFPCLAAATLWLWSFWVPTQSDLLVISLALFV